MAISQFIYIFCLQNPMAFEDRFWSQFVCMSIKVFSLLSQWVWHTLTPRQPMNYFICTGFDPTTYSKIPVKVYGFFEILTILIQFVTYFKIYQFKSRDNHMNFSTFHNRERVITNIMKDSLPSFLSNLLSISTFTLSTFFMIYISNLEPSKLNLFPNSFIVHFVCMCLSFFLAMSFLGSYYINHAPLRKFIFTCLFETMQADLNT